MSHDFIRPKLMDFAILLLLSIIWGSAFKIFFRERYILKGEGPNQISWAGALVECFYMYPTSDEQSLEQNTDLYQF